MTRPILLLSVCLAAACGADASTPEATAKLTPLGSSGVQGTVEFFHGGEGEARVEADITGLTPGKHGIHVHEFGDCSAPDGMSAGGHFNPDGVDHGAPNTATHHGGDFGNVEADASGHAKLTLTIDTAKFSLGDDKYSVLGRGLIVHEKTDDFGQPTGNAGGRVACAVIKAASGDTKPVTKPAGT